MKRYLLAFFSVVSSLCLKAQWVSIPDSNFGTWLNTHNYSQCLQGNNAVGWQMDTTCNAVVTAYSVYCSHANISDLNGIQYFDGLRTLNCRVNQLASIFALPDSLTYLDCDSNQLTTLPALPNSLRIIIAYVNSFISLPVLPDSLVNLDCRYGHLVNLPPLPNSLTTLQCIYNQLTSLPALPNSLTRLQCGYNQLSNLPALPNSLTWLSCDSNHLNSLPPLPNVLKILDITQNQFTNLPTLPNSITSFLCRYNQLTSLPSLPDSLWQLWCNNNPLTTLPPLPKTLRTFICSYCSLTSIPELPDSLIDFQCSYNTNLTCLPELKKIKYFYFDSTGITCLPNYPQSNLSSSPPLNTFPLCDFFNSTGCPVYWNINGKTFYDSNVNCANDAGDIGLLNMKIRLSSGGILQQSSYNASGGFYSFDTHSYGNYEVTLDTTNIPFSVFCPTNGLLLGNITPLDSIDYNKDFSLICKQGFDVGAWSLASNSSFRPANTATLFITAGDLTNFYGAHCAAGVSGTVTVTINGPASYNSPASGALTPSNVTGNTITYNVADFGAVNFFSDFNMMVQTDTTAQISDEVCITVSVTPTAGDNNPANNTLTQCFTVVGSYDPNDKDAYPSGDINTAQEWLTYTIRFQNTGTAEAQHVYVDDTLDTDLDASSFQLLGYSHQPLVQIKQNTVRFNFPNINLPDSNTNEPLSHGYVQYKIKLKENLPVGTTINNTAFIYFDFNAPVVTNTTTNTIVTATGVSEIRGQKSEIRLYPNPTNTILNIQTENFNPVLVSVFDINGKKIREQKYTPQIDVSLLTSGIYFIELKGKYDIARKKFVKM